MQTRSLILLLRCIIHHIQAERGVAISAEAWKLAVSHAEGQVILAEKKVERQRHAHDIRYAKLMVSCYSYRACIYFSLLLSILYPL